MFFEIHQNIGEKIKIIDESYDLCLSGQFL